MDEQFELVVIGAGPAGCSTAREAALRRSLESSLRVGDWVSRRGRPLLHLASRAACTRLGRRLISRALA